MALAADALSAAGGTPPVAADPGAGAPGPGRDVSVDSTLLLRDHVRGTFAYNRTTLAGHAVGAIIVEIVFAGVAPRALCVAWGVGFAIVCVPRRPRRALCTRRADDGRRARGAPAHLARRRPRVRCALGCRGVVVLAVRERPAPARARPRRLHVLRRLRTDPGAAVPPVRLLRPPGLRAGHRAGRAAYATLSWSS